MWICSTLGYFSIVKSDRNNGEFLVRARSVKDLEIIKRETGLENDVVVLPNTDYAARLIVSTEQLGRIFEVLEKSIDYSNFKKKIINTPAQSDKHGSYGDIWAIMFQYQQESR